jgi:hypothetical protein
MSSGLAVSESVRPTPTMMRAATKTSTVLDVDCSATPPAVMIAPSRL